MLIYDNYIFLNHCIIPKDTSKRNVLTLQELPSQL